MLESVRSFLISLLPWHSTFSVGALGFVFAYVLAQVMFCLALRRLAMSIPGPLRMCSPIGLWVLVIPGVGALASFTVLRHVFDAATAATDAHHIAPPRGVARAFAVAYGVSRLLILVPGMLVPALLLQTAAATGFVLRLKSVADSLRTPELSVA